MHEITSQPLDRAQDQQVRRVEGWPAIQGHYALYSSDASKMTFQACDYLFSPAGGAEVLRSPGGAVPRGGRGRRDAVLGGHEFCRDGDRLQPRLQASIFDLGGLGIVGDAPEVSGRLSGKIKRQRAGAQGAIV